MKKGQSVNGNSSVNHKVKNGGANNGFLPSSFKFISSCIKTVSSNVRCAGASVAGSISAAAAASDSDDHRKDQVLFTCFDRLVLSPSSFKHVLLIGYSNGFQVLDVDNASNVCELVSRRDDPVTFLQMQPIPTESDGQEGYINSHPMLLVVACDEAVESIPAQSSRDGFIEPQAGNFMNSPTTLRFYSLRSHGYVHSLRFRSTIYMVRSSPEIVAVGLATQIYCFDALTLENKFSVLTYPVPQLGGQGSTGVNIGYGPMAVGPRWLAYSSNNPMISNTGRLSPQSLSPSPGVSPSTSPGNGNLVARYAMESSKQLASGLINLGDMGYKTLSKYCHELLPDGSSSPVSSSTGWKVGRGPVHSSETDAAGMVVVKDFKSRAIISQFRAHKSPISVLCFDPSGTLLVTASIRGNNINIFRIMPPSHNGSSVHSNDWTSSHVHLYKLHRGVTPAVIQDICFSNYSQWVAIISTRGTCHIFVLSPFGGETGLQLQHTNANGTMLAPILSVPWWSASPFSINQLTTTPPPAPITLSVVSRIKNVSGWLNTVSNAASSVAGRVSAPSGVVAAVFHSCVHQDVQRAPQNSNALEHLLAFTPGGHLIQYEMVPSLGGEQGDSSLRTGTGPLVQMQDDELGVKAEPVQWWDVCRRADWPEREERVQEITLKNHGAMDSVTDTYASEDDEIGGKDISKTNNQSHWYLSNAEVQSRSWRIPVWQNSKICFYTMSLQESKEQYIDQLFASGEIEIENIPVTEVEIKRRDLLPVFDHFQRIHSNWNDERSSFDGRFPGSSYVSSTGKEKLEDTASNVVKKSYNGSSQISGVDEMGSMGVTYPPIDRMDENDGARESGFLSSLMPNQTSSTPELSTNIVSSLEEGYIVNSPSPPKSGSFSTGGISGRDVQSSNSALTSQASNTSSNHSEMSMNISNDEGPIHEDMCDPVDFAQYFKEGYCKASTNNGSCELTKPVTDDIDGSDSPGEKKVDDDEESDDMLGGVFNFSEEG